MSDIYFWNECKKTLEKDLSIEEYSTWISPLMLKENKGIRPKSYSVLAPNEFILNWVEENYSGLITDRLMAITSNSEVNITFEVNKEEMYCTVCHHSWKRLSMLARWHDSNN